MHVAILGSGGVALGYADCLAAAGHAPVLWSSSQEGTRALQDAPHVVAGLTEDLPFGILPVLRIAEALGMKAPLHAVGLSIVDGLYGHDFTRDNDLLPRIDLAALLAVSPAA